MDFIMGLPNTSQHHDSIWVIVNRLTKTAHFIPVHTEICWNLYRSDCLATRYTQDDYLESWPSVCGKVLGAAPRGSRTKLIWSSAYHPQTDGQTERVNQILEDMLRACVIHYGKNWDKCLSLAEFSYNNSYQASLKMAPFEAVGSRTPTRGGVNRRFKI